MKKIFRFLIQELNGFFVTTVPQSLETFVSYIYDFYAYMESLQIFLDTDKESEAKYTLMSDADIIGVARTAGIASVLVSAESNTGSIKFTTGLNAEVDGIYYTERGLFNISRELFDFFRMDQSDYPTDINTLSSKALRTSLVAEDTPIIGYVGESTQIFDSVGNIDLSKLLPEPPTGEAWVPFYGENYLYMAESFLRESFVVPPILTELLLASQIVRYNGPSTGNFLEITRIIMGDSVMNISFESSYPNVLVNYYRNPESTQTSVIERLAVWTSITQDKFPSYILTEKEQ